MPNGVDLPTLTDRTDLPPVVKLAGTNCATVPIGSPVTERFTVCAAPEVKAVDTANETVRPCCTNTTAGFTDSENSDGRTAFTVNATVVACEPEDAVPVTVMLVATAAALAAAVTVIVELCPEDTDAGVNETVTPEGKPVAERETDSALPEVMAVAMLEVAEPPAAMEKLAGLAEIEKSLAGVVTVRETVVACEPEDAIPVTVMLVVAAAALAAAVTVIVELCPEDTDAGVNETITPEGKPEAERETDSALPEVMAVPMLEVAEPPAATEMPAGLAEIEKSLAGVVTTSGAGTVAEEPVAVAMVTRTSKVPGPGKTQEKV
jgi:hypothetical protein